MTQVATVPGGPLGDGELETSKGWLMGMFDEVLCECELPAGLGLTDRNFQTKSLWCSMDRFTITKEGRLMAPETPQGLFGYTDDSMPERYIDTNYHGDVLLRTSVEGKGELIELVARFTHGQLEWLRPFDELSKMERMFLI